MFIVILLLLSFLVLLAFAIYWFFIRKTQTQNPSVKPNTWTPQNKVDFNYYKTYYTQEILDFVNSYFDDDFTNFNYKKIIKLSNFLENN